jgi:hypothetical protein
VRPQRSKEGILKIAATQNLGMVVPPVIQALRMLGLGYIVRPLQNKLLLLTISKAYHPPHPNQMLGLFLIKQI